MVISQALISVIIAAHNAEATIVKCLESVLTQTHTNLEVICVDDGSTDRTLSLIQDFSERDFRVRYLSTENAGPGAARNRGILMARGEWVSFVDADDWLLPNALQTLIRQGVQESADLVLFDEQRLYTYGEEQVVVRHPWTLKNDLAPRNTFTPMECLGTLYQIVPPGPCTKFFRTKMIHQAQLRFDEHVSRAEDVSFVIEALTVSNRISIVNQVLYTYCISENSGVNSSFDKHPFAIVEALESLQARLRINGLYSIWRRDYQAFAVGQILYTLRNFDSVDVFVNFYSEFKNQVIYSLDLSDFQFQGLMPGHLVNEFRALRELSSLEFLKVMCLDAEKSNTWRSQEVENLKRKIESKRKVIETVSRPQFPSVLRRHRKRETPSEAETLGRG